MNGTDPHIHDGRPHRLLNALANALVREGPRPTVRQLELIYADLRAAAPVIRRNLRATSLFQARAFADLVIAAQAMRSASFFERALDRQPSLSPVCAPADVFEIAATGEDQKRRLGSLREHLYSVSISTVTSCSSRHRRRACARSRTRLRRRQGRQRPPRPPPVARSAPAASALARRARSGHPVP